MLRKILFVLISVIALHKSNAQNFDSLKVLLRANPVESERIKILNSLTYNYVDINLDSAEKFSRIAITLIPSVNAYKDQAEALKNHSTVEKLRGQYASSLRYNYDAMKLCDDANDSSCISAIANNLATTYNLMGDYGAAVEKLLISIAIDEARKDTLGLGIDYINLGYSYFESKNYDKALEYARKSHDYLLLANDKHGETYALELLASVYLGKLQPEKAKPFIDASLQLAKETKNEYTFQNNLKQLGDYHFQKEVYDSAHHYYRLSMESNAENSYSDNLLLSTVAMARCYFAQNNISKAIATAEEGYRLSMLGKNKNFTQEICSLLGNIYASAKDLPKSNHFLRLSSLYKDSIMSQSISQSLESRIIQSRLTKEQNEKKAIALSLQQKEEQVYWQRLVILIVGISLLSISIMLIFVRNTNKVRKRVNAELKIKNEQLESLNREISGLIQTIVHDLKSPFNTLQGIFSLLELEKVNAESAELLAHGRKAVTNGQEIIQQLLTIREAEENILTVTPTAFESKDLINDVVGDYAGPAKSKDITLEVNTENEMITTDRLILRRVLDNLISNAIKFTPRQGHVTISGRKSDSEYVLEISDNGPGFSSHDMDKIFGKFQRLSARPTGGESSNGLGLAIVDILLKKINGTIALNTEQGKGSHFMVRIPV